MSPLGLLVSAVIVVLMFTLPRRWATLPLLMGAAYVPGGQLIEIGPLNFTIIRVLIAVGLLRIISKGETLSGRLNTVDRLMIVWAVWLACSSVFHISSTFITRLGVAFDALGIYFLFRVFVQDERDILMIFKIACVLFIPLAAEMMLERMAGRNLFALMGGTSESVLFRHGHFRAKGPFGHPILAGTVGGLCLPMALYLWRQDRKLAMIGLASTGGVILASASSGPIMTAFSIIGAMALWTVRDRMRAIRWLTVLLIVVLDIVMQDPVYYLVARIDISGGSTGWYRAQLIKSALEHWDTWWLAGTDYTRNWMHVAVNARHADITNYYLQMGVWGGMPLMLLFIGTLAAAFGIVGRILRANESAPVEQRFMIWTLGAILFGHATTFFSVSYFDQTFVFLYLVLAGIASIESVQLSPAPAAAESEPVPAPGCEPDLAHLGQAG